MRHLPCNFSVGDKVRWNMVPDVPQRVVKLWGEFVSLVPFDEPGKEPRQVPILAVNPWPVDLEDMPA